MRKYLFILMFLLLSAAIHAQTPAWNDSFESGKLAGYLQGAVPKGATLEKAGADGGYALRLAPGVKTEVMLKEFPTEPGVKYQFRFSGKTDGPDVAGKNPAVDSLFFTVDKTARGLLTPGWEIRVLDAQGRLPFEGHLKSFWQYCSSGDWYAYRQSFYTPPGAKTIQVIFFNPGGKNTLLVDNVTLEKSAEHNLLTSGETFTGLFDYSGWTELSKARIVENNGKFTLKIDPNGYALTDPIPVQPGEYKVGGKKPNATAFFYDADMRRIGTQGWASAKFTVPQGCAYMQLFFSPGEIEGASVTPAPEVKK